jgi:membrane protein YdbS with pleckstrin-like domain
MVIPSRLLGEGEQVELGLRPHWKTLVAPALVLLVATPLASYLAAVSPDGGSQKYVRGTVAIVWVLVVAKWSVWPFLTWLTTSYAVTNRRIITRAGVVARHGRDMPLSRINDVSFSHSGVLERMLGCGTLVVESAGERGQLVLTDVPHVEDVQRDVYRLADLDEADRRSGGARSPADDGT